MEKKVVNKDWFPCMCGTDMRRLTTGIRSEKFVVRFVIEQTS